MDYTASRAVLDALERERVEHAVFGAGAMNLLGLARFTEDLDLFVAPAEENIARLRRAPRLVFDAPSIDEITAEDLLGEYPDPDQARRGIHVRRSGGRARLFRRTHRERGQCAHPVRMKRDTDRLKDRADAALLRERFRLDEEQ